MFEKIRPYLNFRYFLYFFSFIAGWPCVFYLMGWLPHYTVNYVLLFVMAMSYVIIRKCGQFDKPINDLILIQVFGWIFFSLIHMDTSYYTRIILLLTTFAILRIQQDEGGSLDFCKTYDVWLVVQAISGTIGILLVLGGLLQPIFKFVEMDMRPGYFFGLFTTNTYFGGLVRNAGFYDEPGALAFWGIYALIINKMFVKNTKIEILLIVGLLSTMSVAYFIQLAIYLLVFYRKQSWKLIMIAAVILITLKFITSYNEAMDSAFWGRFQYDESTGTISGDNRSVLMERCWRIFCDYPILGMGARNLVSPEVASKYGFVGANFFFNWAADGIVGAIITYLPLIYLFPLGRYDKKLYGIGLLMLLGFLQRPYDSTQLLYPMMTYTIVYQAYYSIFYRNE